ncbi:MAG: hypothetical protein ACYTGN_11020 [Planctomycetota bacterium]
MRAQDGLRSIQREDGLWVHAKQNAGHPLGNTVLALQALRNSGVGPKDPSVTKAFAGIDKFMEKNFAIARVRVGSIGIYLSLLATQPEIRMGGEIADLGLTREEMRARDKKKAPKLSRARRKKIKEVIEFLVEAQQGGLWYYHNGKGRNARSPEGDLPPGGFAKSSFDIVETHLVLMGLRDAQRAGIRVKKSVFEVALKTMLNQRHGSSGDALKVLLRGWDQKTGEAVIRMSGTGKPRAFFYSHKRSAFNVSTTLAGVHCVKMCADALGNSKLAREGRQAALDGMAYLLQDGDAFLRPVAYKDGRVKGNYMYVAYVMDRFAMEQGIRWVNDIDWYRIVGEGLLDRENSSSKPGIWHGGNSAARYSPSIETSITLLVFKRARVAITTSEG